MTLEQLKAKFPNASHAFIQANTVRVELNSDIAQNARALAELPMQPAKPAKRIRQRTKPLLNKLETEWLTCLARQYPLAKIRSQARRYQLGNGIWYKPDFTAFVRTEENDELKETAWEVKGEHAFRGGFENLKVAAALWTEVRWILVWKDKNGAWSEQIVLP